MGAAGPAGRAAGRHGVGRAARAEEERGRQLSGVARAPPEPAVRAGCVLPIRQQPWLRMTGPPDPVDQGREARGDHVCAIQCLRGGRGPAGLVGVVSAVGVAVSGCCGWACSTDLGSGRVDRLGALRHVLWVRGVQCRRGVLDHRVRRGRAVRSVRRVRGHHRTRRFGATRGFLPQRRRLVRGLFRPRLLHADIAVSHLLGGRRGRLVRCALGLRDVPVPCLVRPFLADDLHTSVLMSRFRHVPVPGHHRVDRRRRGAGEAARRICHRVHSSTRLPLPGARVRHPHRGRPEPHAPTVRVRPFPYLGPMSFPRPRPRRCSRLLCRA